MVQGTGSSNSKLFTWKKCKKIDNGQTFSKSYMKPMTWRKWKNSGKLMEMIYFKLMCKKSILKFCDMWCSIERLSQDTFFFFPLFNLFIFWKEWLGYILESEPCQFPRTEYGPHIIPSEKIGFWPVMKWKWTHRTTSRKGPENNVTYSFQKLPKKIAVLLVQSKMHIESAMKIYIVRWFCGFLRSPDEMDPNIYKCYFINSNFTISVKVILYQCSGITFGCE